MKWPTLRKQLLKKVVKVWNTLFYTLPCYNLHSIVVIPFLPILSFPKNILPSKYWKHQFNGWLGLKSQNWQKCRQGIKVSPVMIKQWSDNICKVRSLFLESKQLSQMIKKIWRRVGITNVKFYPEQSKSLKNSRGLQKDI